MSDEYKEQIEQYHINSWTQPMHLFISNSDDAICGISKREANRQGVDSKDWDATVFPASDNFESFGELQEYPSHEYADHCPECWGAIQEDGEDNDV